MWTLNESGMEEREASHFEAVTLQKFNSPALVIRHCYCSWLVRDRSCLAGLSLGGISSLQPPRHRYVERCKSSP
jgi:hypothetical protein